MVQGEDLITTATRVAHQVALEDHLCAKETLASPGICVDFAVMVRYPLADFVSAVEHTQSKACIACGNN